MTHPDESLRAAGRNLRNLPPDKQVLLASIVAALLGLSLRSTVGLLVAVWLLGVALYLRQDRA